jgi:hypothetical protein
MVRMIIFMLFVDRYAEVEALGVESGLTDGLAVGEALGEELGLTDGLAEGEALGVVELGLGSFLKL